MKNSRTYTIRNHLVRQHKSLIFIMRTENKHTWKLHFSYNSLKNYCSKAKQNLSFWTWDRCRSV